MSTSKLHLGVIGSLTIIGVGLIGGSLARSLKKANFAQEVVGFGRSENNLLRAQELGVIDRWTLNLKEAVMGADVIMLATPVTALNDILPQVATHLKKNTIVTDAGSVKGTVARGATRAVGQGISQFVPGHPIAGAEKTGVEASREDVFQGQKVILTPLSSTASHAVDRVRKIWEVTGASVSLMDPDQHDKLLALTSHLPHALAFCLVNTLAEQPNADQCYALAASGFYDITRIASSDPVMWRDIFLENKYSVLSRLTEYSENIGHLIQLIETEDADGLTAEFRKSNETRSLIQKHR